MRTDARDAVCGFVREIISARTGQKITSHSPAVLSRVEPQEVRYVVSLRVLDNQ